MILEKINAINLYELFLKMAKDLWDIRQFAYRAMDDRSEIMPFVFRGEVK
ncbi:hypothetical protein [Campylobacter gastrosuis]|uniref:Uncharacterized protein n=1 Tax=Campylobacter gastrosuis TaxID=2974576 RepID=A0ABT7HSX7_9BACT|nr:hypothetical protein [Campylobacter gastrosuis]MDL0090029.1 hypothetical protein [Campylobacter gastrosuis]